jgi:hypothetical protein
LRVDSTRSAVGFVCRSACRFYTPECDKHNKTMRDESTRMRVESTRMRVIKKKQKQQQKLMMGLVVPVNLRFMCICMSLK